MLGRKFETCTVTDFPEGLQCGKCSSFIEFGAAYVRVPGVFKTDSTDMCVECVYGKTEVCVDVPR